MNSETFSKNEIKELNIQQIFLKKEEMDNLPVFILRKIEKILLIANTISLLKIADLKHFQICFDEMFKFQLFYEFENIQKYEYSCNAIFNKKNEELQRLFQEFQVFNVILHSLIFKFLDRKGKEKSWIVEEEIGKFENDKNGKHWFFH